MDESLRYLIYSIVATIIVLFAFTFNRHILDIGLRFNRVVVEDTHHKASSRYELPTYNQPILYISPNEAYTDIISSDASITKSINGAALDATIISKAANGDSIAINALKNALTNARYHRVTGYDSDGNITYINFIGD